MSAKKALLKVWQKNINSTQVWQCASQEAHMLDDIKYTISETMQFQSRYDLKQIPCNTGNIRYKNKVKYKVQFWQVANQ